jgi:hypothetical protein
MMSEETTKPFDLEDDSERNDSNLNHHELNNNDDENTTKSEDNQWINELRVALERGCDLGSIRNIGKCRPLTDDLRVPVWKVRN